MSEALFTIVVIPRERFSMARTSLLDLYRNTPGTFPLIYLDGNSPAEHSSWLQAEARERGFQIIRTEHYLSQHAAYNLALPFVQTKYVIFCDNDVTFSHDWAAQLLDCAEKSGGAVVCPAFLEKIGPHTQIHMAGGRIVLARENGRLVYHETHLLAHRPVEELDTLPEIQETALIEYHAFLGRTETLKRINPFDQNLLSAKDHPDACLTLKSAGERCFMTKKARVIYHVPPPFAKEDLPFFTTRWSEPWNRHSFAYFGKKWDMEAAVNPWFAQHRRSPLQKITVFLQPLIGSRNARRVYYRILDPIIRLWEPAWNRYLHRRRYGNSFEQIFGLFDLNKPYPPSLRLPLPKPDSVFSMKDSSNGG
jgi:glycosyltransferase involved in cell wall biosynthesis